jgi:hypothetical protein
VVLRAALAQAREQGEAAAAELLTERKGLEQDLAWWHRDVQQLTAQLQPGEDNGPALARLAELQERIRLVEERVRQLHAQIQAAQGERLDEQEATTALMQFDPVWELLTPREQARLIDLLVRQVDYDGARGKVTIAFHETGFQTLAYELAQHQRGGKT